MKVYTLGLYEKAMPENLSFKEKLLHTGEAGYDCLEISIDETEQKLSRLYMSKQERLELVKLMYETGVPIRTMCLSGHRKYPLGSIDEETSVRGIKIMELAIELAEDLGIRLIQLAGYDVYYETSTEDTRKRFAYNLDRAVRMAACAGVMLGFETMETEFMNTVRKSMGYVNLIQSPYLNVYPDTGNLVNAAYAYHTDVLEDLFCGKGHITALHLKESLLGIFREVPYGSGHVPFEQMIEKAWSLGVRKYTAEFWYKGNSRWREDLESVCFMMRSFLDKLADEERYP